MNVANHEIVDWLTLKLCDRWLSLVDGNSFHPFCNAPAKCPISGTGALIANAHYEAQSGNLGTVNLWSFVEPV